MLDLSTFTGVLQLNFVQNSTAALVLGFAVFSNADAAIDCDLYDTSAKGAMEARQKGIPLADAMKVLKNGVGSSKEPEAVEAYAALKLAFVEAYKTPKFSTPTMQQEAVNEFRSKFYGECLEAVSEIESKK